MLDQVNADDPCIGVNGNHRVDRLSRIAGGADEIRCDESPADGLATFQHRHNRQVGADRTIAVGTGDEVACRHLAKIGDEGRGLRLCGRGDKAEQGEES